MTRSGKVLATFHLEHDCNEAVCMKKGRWEIPKGIWSLVESLGAWIHKSLSLVGGGVRWREKKMATKQDEQTTDSRENQGLEIVQNFKGKEVIVDRIAERKQENLNPVYEGDDPIYPLTSSKRLEGRNSETILKNETCSKPLSY